MLNRVTLLLLGGALALAGNAQSQALTFGFHTLYTAGSTDMPYGVAVADVNADGKPDLLTSNYTTSRVSVLLGTGTGTFLPATSYPAGTGTYPFRIAVRDFNGDGKPDLVTANDYDNSVSVLLGNNNGTFQSSIRYDTGINSYPRDITVADVNGDNKLDLLTANYFNDTAGVLLGNGNGTFSAFNSYSTGTVSIPVGIAVADANGDGKPDLFTANRSNAAGVLLNTGTGTFQPVALYPTAALSQPERVAAADVNGDGKIDLLTANLFSTIDVWLGNGNGTFQARTTYSANSPGYTCTPRAIAVADINNDGKPDVLTANGTSGTVSILLGNGNGTFQNALGFYVGGAEPFDLAVADVNGDNRLDVVTANSSSGKVAVLLNTTPTPLAARTTLPGASATLAPNPATDRTTLSAAGLPATVAQVQATLLDATGRVIGRQQLAAAQGATRAEVPTAGLAAGLYLLRLVAYDTQGQLSGSLPTQRLSVQ